MKRLAACLALGLLAACSKDKAVDEPTELVEIASTARVERVWSASVGGGDQVMRLGLGLAVDGDRVFAAGRGGEVAAFDRSNGRAIWRSRTKSQLAAGVGVGDELAVVASSNGDVIALNSADGVERWRAKVAGEVLASPSVGSDAVIVRTVDGRLRGLALADGKELWLVEEQVPRLSLRGNASPVVARDLVIAGFDNGKVIAVTARDGDTVWETPVVPPRGRTELERLNDIDSAVKVIGDDVFVAGFQGRAAMLALDSGQIWWTRDVSSYRGVDVDDDAMYVASSDGEVVALRRRTGVELWRQSALRFRRLSAPVVTGEHVAVADFEGYMHWFDRTTGAPAGRTGGLAGRVSNPPVAVGDVVYVLSDSGRLNALRAVPLARTPASAAETPAPAEPAPTDPAPTEPAPAVPAVPPPSN
jgi:outer membrane protein assembly factor BamB